MTHLYNCRHDGDQYRITKFDSDLNPEASYLCTLTECECPAAARDTCRHRQMLHHFLARGAIGTDWFFDHDRGGWVQLALSFIDEAGPVLEHIWNAEPGGHREQASVPGTNTALSNALDHFLGPAEPSVAQPASIDRRGR